MVVRQALPITPSDLQHRSSTPAPRDTPILIHLPIFPPRQRPIMPQLDLLLNLRRWNTKKCCKIVNSFPRAASRSISLMTEWIVSLSSSSPPRSIKYKTGVEMLPRVSLWCFYYFSMRQGNAGCFSVLQNFNSFVYHFDADLYITITF